LRAKTPNPSRVLQGNKVRRFRPSDFFGIRPRVGTQIVRPLDM
jgi:hypothetical protein